MCHYYDYHTQMSGLLANIYNIKSLDDHGIGVGALFGFPTYRWRMNSTTRKSAKCLITPSCAFGWHLLHPNRLIFRRCHTSRVGSICKSRLTRRKRSGGLSNPLSSISMVGFRNSYEMALWHWGSWFSAMGTALVLNNPLGLRFCEISVVARSTVGPSDDATAGWASGSETVMNKTYF